MSRLFITGDSFTYVFPTDQNENVWHVDLAKKLNLEIVNVSLWGCSQDFNWRVVHNFKENTEISITPDDQLIVLLTSPSRFWFFEDRPDVTNPNVVDIDCAIGTERAQIASNYFRYIQRSQLDRLSVKIRLGWLASTARQMGWKPPLVIFGFEQFIGEPSDFPELKFSKGSLAENVSSMEQIDPKDQYTFRAYDARFGHLCLSNHKILSDKIYQTLVNNSELDLTTGFIRHFLTPENLLDPIFAKKEFSPLLYGRYLENVNKPLKTPWYEKFK